MFKAAFLIKEPEKCLTKTIQQSHTFLAGSIKPETRAAGTMKGVINFQSSPLTNRVLSIFEANRFVHRPVTLHGHTAGFRFLQPPPET